MYYISSTVSGTLVRDYPDMLHIAEYHDVSCLPFVRLRRIKRQTYCMAVEKYLEVFYTPEIDPVVRHLCSRICARIFADVRVNHVAQTVARFAEGSPYYIAAYTDIVGRIRFFPIPPVVCRMILGVFSGTVQKIRVVIKPVFVEINL